MKPFDQTAFFRLTAPVICRILPKHLARSFWCLFIASALLVQLVNVICLFGNNILEDSADNSIGFYYLVVMHTIGYGAWLWGFWYSFYQLAQLSTPNRLITPQLLSCSVTGGLLMYLLTAVTEQLAGDQTLLIRGMLVLAFAVGVLLPTLWHPVNSAKDN